MKDIRNLGVPVLVTFFSLFAQNLSAQVVDNVGSGRAIDFDGIDDYIDLGNIYDDLSLPVTISVWVKIDPVTGYACPIFNSQDNLPLYNGVTFIVSASAVSIQYGDGQGENNPSFRRGKSAAIPNIVGRWAHLTAIMRGPSDMELFINGINVGGAYGGDSNLPMASAFPADNAKIGFWLSNGITTRYKGVMDELRIYNRALSETEIRQDMCKKLSGSENGLIGYWSFDETSGNILKDKSANHFDGQLMGNSTRVFSGAPLGDESTFLYTNNWTSKSVKHDIIAENIQGNPEGLHIYKVLNTPSQANGLASGLDVNPYYGVFVASLDQGNIFNLKYDGASLCDAFKRSDNSQSPWTAMNTTTSISNRIEIIPIISVNNEIVYLGPDRVICDQTSFLLTTGLTDMTGKSFLWSTGQTSQSISVTQSGLYSVKVSDLCSEMEDTVNVIFLKKPAFNLGTDGKYCLATPKILKPFDDPSGKEYKWQDGSTNSTFEVKTSGSYWVTVGNICGVLTDTIHIVDDEVGEVNIGPDKIICDQASHFLTSGLANLTDQKFLWSTGETSSSITITKSGLYTLQVSNNCTTRKDTTNIIFLQKPGAFNLGEDQIACVLQSRVLKPYNEADNMNFLWQDGSTGNSFEVKDYGMFWVKAENACGFETDTIHIKNLVEQFKFVPNIITPNDDGLNQFFVLDTERSYAHRLTVYNRWGIEVFSTSDYKNDWDGGDLPSGVYFYQLSGNCVEEKLGSLTISR